MDSARLVSRQVESGVKGRVNIRFTLCQQSKQNSDRSLSFASFGPLALCSRSEAASGIKPLAQRLF